MFPDDGDVKAVAAAMFDPFEYLILRKHDGLLNTDFKQSLGNISYHIPCHLRVQNIGKKTKDVLELVPETQVNAIERCSGHDGTWGVKSEYFADSMKIGKPVFKQMAKNEPDYISSDCAIAARHIKQGMEESKAQKLHPLTLIRMAYGDQATQPKPATQLPLKQQQMPRKETNDDNNPRQPVNFRNLRQNSPRIPCPSHDA